VTVFTDDASAKARIDFVVPADAGIPFATD
jgi:hypothetical protein